MDEIMVGIIVAGAIVYMVKSVVQSCGKQRPCGSGGCGGCSLKDKCTPPGKLG